MLVAPHRGPPEFKQALRTDLPTTFTGQRTVRTRVTPGEPLARRGGSASVLGGERIPRSGGIDAQEARRSQRLARIHRESRLPSDREERAPEPIPTPLDRTPEATALELSEGGGDRGLVSSPLL
jgi:hypothetical protein